jgi:hypothetical protein
MNERPRSVTIISWIFIICGSIALLLSFLRSGQYVMDFRSQHPLLYGLSFLGPALAVLSGVFMRLGFSWARWLLFAWFAITAIGFVQYSPLRLFLPGLLFAVAIFFLFRSPATEYFRHTGHQPPEIPKTDDKKVA